MAYSLDFREKVVGAYLADEGSQKQIAADFRITAQTVRRWVETYKETGSLQHRSPPGRPGKLVGEPKKILATLVNEHNDATEHELVQLLFEHTGIRVHRSAIGYHLRRMNLTLKKNIPGIRTR